MNPEEQESYEKTLRRIETVRARGKTNAVLDLSNMGLSVLPPEIGQIDSLTQVNLSGNKLSVLPPEIGRLSNLKTLRLQKNQLKKLPIEIGQLSALKLLTVHNNLLTKIPSEIGELNCLVELVLGNNPLESIPSSIGHCRALQRLSLNGTSIKTLPSSLRNLTRLSHLRLVDVSELHIPPELGGYRENWGEPNAQQVLDYYFSRQEQGDHSLNEVKLLLLGRGEAGKTCVSRALRGKPFEKEIGETQGIEIDAWWLGYPDDDQAPIKVHIWDFAGQEITHETHRFFLTERSLYLVVLDGRGGQQMEEAEYWLSHVERYGTYRKHAPPMVKGFQARAAFTERSPAIVVLNKWQKHGPYDVEKRRLQREYPNIKAFIETDCATNHGITKLTKTIRNVLSKMPSVRQTWPVSYFEVRQLLDAETKRGRHFVKWDAFRKLCKKGGEEDKGRQQSMAENLNALGVALYYGEDARLRDTRILNPNWAANGLYGIVRGVNQAPYQGQRGYLWAGEFAEVLSEGLSRMAEDEEGRRPDLAAYPEERDGVRVHEFLLELMLDRELGFQADTVKGKALYLLPGLLTMDEPAVRDFDVAAHIDAAEVRFRYLYELLPAGVMSRFIVRTHTLSEGQHRWQRGVVLAWGDAFGLVLAERRRNPRLDVYIRGGSAADQQQLAGVIRANLTAIHRELPAGLKGEEQLEMSPAGEQFESVEMLKQLERENKPVQVMTPRGSVDLPVTKELERVEPVAARSGEAPGLKVFVSYSHADYKMLDRLKVHLDILTNEGKVDVWYDGKIRPGSEWDDAIRREMKEADLVIFLVSNGFFQSRYIKGVELKEAKRRWDAGEAEVLPVMLEPTEAFGAHPWLKKVQATPVVKGNLRPLTSFRPMVNGWSHVEKALRAGIEEVVKRRK